MSLGAHSIFETCALGSNPEQTIAICCRYSHESWNVVGQRNNEGWVAPEMMQNGIGFPFSAAGDIFALGCIFFLMVTRGDHPFGSLDFSRDHRAIKGDYELAPLIRLNQPLITDFVLKMIDTLPQRRPTIDCILADNKFWTVLYRSDTSLHELKQQPNFADAMDSFTSEQYIPKWMISFDPADNIF